MTMMIMTHLLVLVVMTKWSTTKPCSYPSLTEMAVLRSAAVWLHFRTMKFCTQQQQQC